MRHQFSPTIAIFMARLRGPQDSEIGCVPIAANDPVMAVMVGGVLVAALSRQEDHQLRPFSSAINHPHLGRFGGIEVDVVVTVGTSAANRGEERLIVFLVDQLGAAARIWPVPPDTPRAQAQRVVLGVEQAAAIGCPADRGRTGDAGITDPARLQVAQQDPILAPPRLVLQPGQMPPIRADVSAARLERGPVPGKRIAVKQHLIDRRFPQCAPHQDREFGFGHITGPVQIPAIAMEFTVLLGRDPGLHLFDQRGYQGLQAGHRGVRVIILGLKVGHGVRGAAAVVAQPVIRVEALSCGCLDDVRNPLGERWIRLLRRVLPTAGRDLHQQKNSPQNPCHSIASSRLVDLFEHCPMEAGGISAGVHSEATCALEEPGRRQAVANTADHKCGQRQPTRAHILVQQLFDQSSRAMDTTRRLETDLVGYFKIGQRSALAPGLLQNATQALKFGPALHAGDVQRPQLFFSSTRSAR